MATMNKLFLWINQSNGDTLSAIPLVFKLKEKYPDTEIVFGCFSQQSYLVEHLPINEIVAVNTPDHNRIDFSPFCPQGFTPICLWLGQYTDTYAHNWENTILVFNRKCEENNIDIRLEVDEYPEIFLPKFDVDVVENAVWIENGWSRSGHNFTNFDIDKISTTFPKLNFYTTGPTNSSRPNVFDMSDKNLIYHANINKKCKYIIGKGSGPFFTSFSNENVGKHKIVVGYNKNYAKFWDTSDPKMIYLDTEIDLIKFIEILEKDNMKVDEEIELATKDAGNMAYHDVNIKNKYAPICAEIVNKHIPKIEKNHTDEDEAFLKENGYLVIKNFLSRDEVEQIKGITANLPGYNAHVPVHSDKVLRVYDSNYPYNVLSYSPEHFYKNSLIVNKMRDPKIISLAQSYFDCFPTIYSLNCWWHKYTNQVYGTQQNHRDYDDFRFLAFFIYLSDIDASNGPHVFYPKTQNGEVSDEKKMILGRAGTAVLADTYAIHRGQPLLRGERLLLWWRYGIHLNKMHYGDGNNLFRVDREEIFSSIEDNLHNDYLFRALVK